MVEKFPENNIFTPKQLEKMAKGAEANKKAEDIRSGDYVVPCVSPGIEEYGSANEAADRATTHKVNKIRSRPQSEFKKRSGAENYGWLNAWQDKNEIDRGKRRKIK